MPKIRVMVVDDAVVLRKLISEALSRDPEIEVVGVAANGSIALQKLTQINPDIITLDVEMPEMDGLQTLKEIRKTHPRLPVIMFSTLTSRGAATTLDCLSHGATDYVTKPSNMGNVTECIERIRQDMVSKIRLHCRHVAASNGTPPPRRAASVVPPLAIPVALRRPGTGIDIVCIGTSTGGPNALAEVFKDFPGDLPVPLVIVQHMPPVFTAMLAERLTNHSKLKFCEGVEGQVLEPGKAYLAPGGHHMVVQREAGRLRLHLHDEPPENSCRPAVDVLFRSVVNVVQGNVLGVVLTGMGHDGLRGCQIIREHGGQVVVQDEASSVVWGMPGCVAEAGLADRIVPLNQVAMEIVTRVRSRRALTV